ncbi:MAG TPA: Hpt domain-containing protein [Armatimonadota bacterium]|nr:Hpt domain-containing protein [Armatimonadota bacterium]HQK93672.1 Hpt domain-containing protein [Armatimonadota bacterium]
MPDSATTAGPDPELDVDLELALDQIGGDRELLVEIAAIFLDSYPDHVAELERNLADNDLPLAARTAHAIKGAVSNFGAPGAIAAALAVEDAAKTGDMAKTWAAFARLKEALAVVHTALAPLAGR